MRVAGLDVGDRTIGVAVSDEMETVAQGVEVLRRTSSPRDVRAVVELVGRYGVGRIVVGLPRSMNGGVGPQAQKVMAFAQELQRAVHVPVDLWDERLTSRMAERAMLEADLSRAKRRRLVDRVAAALILQGYLDARRARAAGDTVVRGTPGPEGSGEADGSSETR